MALLRTGDESEFREISSLHLPRSGSQTEMHRLLGSECDPAVDMRSFGVVSFEVLTGMPKAPFFISHLRLLFLQGRKFCEKYPLTRGSTLNCVTARYLLRRVKTVQDRSRLDFAKKFLKLDPFDSCTAYETRGTLLAKSVSAPDAIQGLGGSESNGKTLQPWLKWLPWYRRVSTRTLLPTNRGRLTPKPYCRFRYYGRFEQYRHSDN